MERIQPNRNKVNRIGLKWTKWIEQDQIGSNRIKVDRLDRIEAMWTEEDRIEPKWAKWTE